MTDAQASRRLGRVVGKYRLERIIGSGGMATVYEARHRNGHRVAVKMLKPAHAVGSEVRARFLREGYAANRVRHEGAVRILDDDVTDDGLVFLVMEHLEGMTLDALARSRGGQLPVGLVLEVGKQLLDVLAAAHDVGVVHRDIKPENVFLRVGGTLLLGNVAPATLSFTPQLPDAGVLPCKPCDAPALPVQPGVVTWFDFECGMATDCQ